MIGIIPYDTTGKTWTIDTEIEALKRLRSLTDSMNPYLVFIKQGAYSAYAQIPGVGEGENPWNDSVFAVALGIIAITEADQMLIASDVFYRQSDRKEDFQEYVRGDLSKDFNALNALMIVEVTGPSIGFKMVPYAIDDTGRPVWNSEQAEFLNEGSPGGGAMYDLCEVVQKAFNNTDEIQNLRKQSDISKTDLVEALSQHYRDWEFLLTSHIVAELEGLNLDDLPGFGQ